MFPFTTGSRKRQAKVFNLDKPDDTKHLGGYRPRADRMDVGPMRANRPTIEILVVRSVRLVGGRPVSGRPITKRL